MYMYIIKMVRPRLGERKLTGIPLTLDRDLMDRFEETLPRKKSVSAAVREYMEAVVEEAERAKKANGLQINRSPIASMTLSNNSNKQSKLDIYFGNWVVNEEKWRKYLNDCEKKDFFKALQSLSKTRTLAINIMNSKGLRYDEW
jgi:hypothetical protein